MSENVDRVCLEVDRETARELLRELDELDAGRYPTVWALAMAAVVGRWPAEERAVVWGMVEDMAGC